MRPSEPGSTQPHLRRAVPESDSGDPMDIAINCRLAASLADRMRDAREELTRRWLDRIVARVTIDPNRVFPTDELLDHIPILVDGVAAYLEDPADEITADVPVIAKAIELGALRHSQGFGAHEILKEYELLGGVLFAFLVRTVDGIDEPCTRGELLACAQRLFRAVSVIQQTTMNHYLRATDEHVREREERLRSFNLTVSHELKNRIGAVLGAGELLRESWIDAQPEKRARMANMVVENAEEMRKVLENLMEISRMGSDARRQRNVLLPEVAAEVVRQLREVAQKREVEIRISPDLPPVEVNAAAVELCLSNYLSNAIKYSDPNRSDRWVEVSGAVRAPDDEPRGCELVVRVRDNGIGVPEEARHRLFERFFRAHSDDETEVEGTGLGLSIVRETIEGLGGRAWTELDSGPGATFAFSLPCRRGADRA